MTSQTWISQAGSKNREWIADGLLTDSVWVVIIEMVENKATAQRGRC